MKTIKPFTQFPNTVLEKITSSKFNGTQYAILLALIRATYGFHEESRTLGIKFFVKATERNRDHLARELTVLRKRNIIIVVKKQTYNESRELALNEDCYCWLQE